MKRKHNFQHNGRRKEKVVVRDIFQEVFAVVLFWGVIVILSINY